MEDQFDIIIIGSGPGGYVAAIKAAKLGKKTALMESREIGGTCLNRGCIPTKTLMHSSHLYEEAQNMKEVGIDFTGLSFDYGKIKEHQDQVVSKVRQGIKGLLEANGVTLLYGAALIQGAIQEESPVAREERNQLNIKRGYRISLSTQEGVKDYFADKVLIATGSKPIIPRIEGVKLENVVTSDELLSLSGVLYRKLLIIGGGVIGVEFATIYRELGCEVEIIEAMDRILPGMDKEISQSIAMSLKKKGIIIHTKSKVTRITKGVEGGLGCEYEDISTGSITDAVRPIDTIRLSDAIKPSDIDKLEASTHVTKADGILLSVGRKANAEGLFGDGFSLEMDGACIKVNQDFETNVSGIYAIGDVIKGKQLAHAASAQGIVAVERMFGKEPTIDINVIPSCIYTNPEVAVAGINEAEAAEKGLAVKIGKYPMLGNSKTILSMGERGFIKVVCDADTDQILGAQLLCDRATDMVGEFASAIVNGLTAEDLASVIRPHPTYCEAITEAVEDVLGMAIHLVPKKK